MKVAKDLESEAVAGPTVRAHGEPSDSRTLARAFALSPSHDVDDDVYLPTYLPPPTSPAVTLSLRLINRLPPLDPTLGSQASWPPKSDGSSEVRSGGREVGRKCPGTTGRESMVGNTCRGEKVRLGR